MTQRFTVTASKALTFLLICLFSVAPLEANFNDYLDDIEVVSRRKVPAVQRQQLQRFYRARNAVQLSQDELVQRHQEFTVHKKKVLRSLWEEKTGLKWTTYQTTVHCKVDGAKVCRQKNWSYDMHHVIPQSHNGPHEWWNVFPLTRRQHNAVHEVGTQCSLLFPASTGARKGGY